MNGRSVTKAIWRRWHYTSLNCERSLAAVEEKNGPNEKINSDVVSSHSVLTHVLCSPFVLCEQFLLIKSNRFKSFTTISFWIDIKSTFKNYSKHVSKFYTLYLEMNQNSLQMWEEEKSNFVKNSCEWVNEWVYRKHWKCYLCQARC